MVTKKLLAAAVGTIMLFAFGAAEAQSKDSQKSTTTKTKDKNTGRTPGATQYAPGRSDNPPPGHGGKVPGQQMKKDKESGRKDSPMRR